MSVQLWRQQSNNILNSTCGQKGSEALYKKYSSIKDGHDYGGYLTSTRNRRLRVQLGNFRQGNHKLQSQTTRWLKDKVQAEELEVGKACGNADEDEVRTHVYTCCCIACAMTSLS